MEGSNFSLENNEENFNRFQEQIKERTSSYKEVIATHGIKSVFPEKYKAYQDQIDSEAFLCVTRVKEIQDLAQAEFKKTLENYKPKVDKLFDVPVQIMDTQLKAFEITLDNKPFEVWQNKDDEFAKKIKELEDDPSLSPELQLKLKELKHIFNKSMEDLFNAKDEQINNLKDLFSSQQKEQSSFAAKEIININKENDVQGDEISARYSAEIFKLVDSFEFNCEEILNKSISDSIAESNNLN